MATFDQVRDAKERLKEWLTSNGYDYQKYPCGITRKNGEPALLIGYYTEEPPEWANRLPDFGVPVSIEQRKIAQAFEELE